MRRYRFVPVCLCSFALSVGLMAPGAVRAAAPSAPQDVVRLGDRDMSCPALAAEINGLSQPGADDVVAAKPKKHGLGFLKVLGAAMPMAGLAGSMGGAMLSSAAGAAQAATATGGATDMMQESSRMARVALAGGTPQQQRKERLTAIFEEKRC